MKLFLIFIVCVLGLHANTFTKVLPYFKRLPPKINYRDERQRTTLTCAAWPPNSKVNLVRQENGLLQLTGEATRLQTWGFVSENQATFPGGLLDEATRASSRVLIKETTMREENDSFFLYQSNSPRLALNRLSASISDQFKNSGSPGFKEPAFSYAMALQLRLEPQTRHFNPYTASISQSDQLTNSQFHCTAETSLGTIISSPFSIRASTLGHFPDMQNRTEVVKFYVANTAFIDCRVPVNSGPSPEIIFYHNNKPLDPSRDDRLKQVTYPDGSIVTLLISKVEKEDAGIYTCHARNPLNSESIISPLKHDLQVIEAQTPVPAQLRRKLFLENGADKSRHIRVHEGQNVTLFCVIEGAPPPYPVSTAPHTPHVKDDEKRFISDRNFATLDIINVKPSDSGTYLCSDTRLTDTVNLAVIRKLSITLGKVKHKSQ
ncbi:hypothetical protein Ciccas_000836 [Cichlidogyrus casuarinus]|uniref:Ig-like domain-containing protein n=1 Tax=Cichlidogyrus casuarinus TaxID=1844966 RepID=A0ABD2QPR1_9PLAT